MTLSDLDPLIVGSMLGDGCLVRVGQDKASYKEQHCRKQRPYLMWKAAQWGDLVSKVSTTTKVVGDRTYDGDVFYTKGRGDLFPYWEMFYGTSPDGRKVFNKLDPVRVTPFALAVWFMDDGSSTGTESKGIRFSVSPRNVDEKRVLCAIFEQYGIQPHVHGVGGNTCITFTTRKSVGIFLDLVGEFIHDSLKYKIEPASCRSLGPAPREKLGLDLLQRYRDQGSTFHAIATDLGVSVQSVSRAWARAGFPSPAKGRPKGAKNKKHGAEVLTTEEANAQLISLDPSSSTYIDDVVGTLIKVPYPWVPPTEEEARRGLEGFFSKTPDSSVSHTGTKVLDHFFPYRKEARYRNLPSAKEAWKDPKQLARAVRFQVAVGDPVKVVPVLRALQANLRSPTGFRPLYARYLIEKYGGFKGASVLDPCAGYGGRALGAVAAGCSYTGFDPHPEAGASYERFFSFLAGAGFLASIGQVHPIPFEDSDLPEGSFDLAITSPPYFNVERYSQDENQSSVRYTTWKEWLSGFLQPMLEKVYRALKPGSTFLLNVNDVQDRKSVLPLVEESRNRATFVGFIHVDTEKMPLRAMNNSKKSEPVLVLKKP